VLRVSDMAMKMRHYVHPHARLQALSEAQHASFLTAHMAAAVLSFVLFTLSLALYEHSTLWSIAAATLSCAPLIFARHVMQKGALAQARTSSVFLYISMACVLSCAGPAAYWGALILLVNALMVAHFFNALSPRSMRVMYALTIGAIIAVVAHVQIVQIDAFALMQIMSVACVHMLFIVWDMVRNYRDLSNHYERNHQRISHVLASYDVMYCLHDSKGQFVESAFSSPSSLSHIFEQFRHKDILSHIHLMDRPLYLKALSDTLHSKANAHIQIRLNKKIGGDDNAHTDRFQIFDVHVTPFHADQICLMTCWQPLEQTHIASTQSDQPEAWKDQILAMMSHELRTPLNAIIGFSEILADPQLAKIENEKKLEYAGLIHQSGHHLLSVVNSILDMSKIQAGHFDINPEPFELALLVDHCCSLLSLDIINNNIILSKQFKEPITVNADRKACKQIILNLLSNAIKFTPVNGTISIGCEHVGHSAVISVADNGIGISADDLPHIGNPFFQAKTDYDRSYEGTGLGLSVVKGLVNLHRGSFSIESVINKGTCVRISLPLDTELATHLPHSSHNVESLAHHRPNSSFDNQTTMVKKIA
jgi:two-component system, cell cycle sensor histidine kinase DivJ